jgi:hypothetical protein
MKPIPHSPLRKAAFRLTCIAIVWLLALGLTLEAEGSQRLGYTMVWMILFSIPAVAIMLIVQQLLRYRMPWLLEIVAMPFAIGGIVYLAIALRS